MPMRFQNRRDLLQFVSGESVIARKLNRAQPKLGFLAAFLNVNMRRLVTLMRIKMEAIPIDSQDSRHKCDSCARGLVAVNPAIL